MKSKICFFMFLIIILIANFSLASYSTVKMSVVEEPVCTIKFNENSNFQKKLLSKDLNNKEVTIQLQVTNEESSSKPSGELILVIDDSESMKNEVEETTRKDLVINSAKTLVTNLLKDNDKLEIGIVRFSTNSDLDKEGSIADASVVSELSSDADSLLSALSNIKADGHRTNLESGLTLAKKQFSQTDNNKYMIVLTDGVPNVAINYDNVYYSDDVIEKTKKQLQSIDSDGINLITMLTAIADENYIPPTNTTKTFGDIIEEIFGTESNPTAGEFHYIEDTEIEKTISETIYNSLQPVEKTLTDIKVVDYFPKEIIDNFDFSYVKQASKGEISATVNTTTNSITWTIPELKSGETALAQYKLKLKQDFSSTIVDKILNTNEKVDITYKDFDGKSQAKTSDVSPKLKLTEPVVTPQKQEEPKPTVLPAAGTPIFVTFFIVAISAVAYSFIKYIKISKDLKF